MRRIVLLLIQCYRYLLSPILGVNCRFEPSCSHYALEAVKYHGAVKGGFLTLKRLARCQPFAKSCYDPVPHE